MSLEVNQMRNQTINYQQSFNINIAYETYDDNQDKGLFTFYREQAEQQNFLKKNLITRKKSKNRKKRSNFNQATTARQQQNAETPSSFMPKLNTQRSIMNLNEAVVIKKGSGSRDYNMLKEYRPSNKKLEKMMMADSEFQYMKNSPSISLNMQHYLRNKKKEGQDSDFVIFKKRTKLFKTQPNPYKVQAHCLQPKQIQFHKPSPRVNVRKKVSDSIHRYRPNETSLKKNKTQNSQKTPDISPQAVFPKLFKFIQKSPSRDKKLRISSQKQSTYNKFDLGRKLKEENESNANTVVQTPYKFIMVPTNEYQRQKRNQRSQLTKILNRFSSNR